MRNKISKIINNLFSSEYKSFRGFLRIYLYRLFFYIGVYKAYRKIQWEKVERLVFVCNGNICRSAFAEVVARSMNLEAVSCGINTHDGKPANELAIQIASENGFDLSKHKTRTLNSLVLRSTDLLIVMETWHIKHLQDALNGSYRYTLLGLWCSPVTPYIQDPFGGSAAYFKICFECIERSVYEIAKRLSTSGN